LLGKNTKWCISATESLNYFNIYYFDYNVDFYILIKDDEKY